jgi:hypothetical protein
MLNCIDCKYLEVCHFEIDNICISDDMKERDSYDYYKEDNED